MSLHGRVSFRTRAKAPPRVACLQDSGDDFGQPGTHGAPSPDCGSYSIGVGAQADARDDAKHAPALGRALADSALGDTR